jgi:protein SCO1/2
MRIAALCFALILSACSRPHWNMTDISGSMPRLAFNLGGVALYFGYTHCPDVCPTTLSDLTQMLGEVKSPDVQVLFVTIDPDRDTDTVLAQYAKAFSPQVMGLRGDANQLAALARTYRVAYSVKKGPPYEVMHSNAVFFFDRDGRARLVTTDTSDPYKMAEDVKRLLQ